jgi:hypothetical protein
VQSHQSAAATIIHVLLDRIDDEAGRRRDGSNEYETDPDSIDPD